MGRRSDFVKRGPCVYLTRVDEAALSRACEEAFPGVKFWEELWDGERWTLGRIEAIHLTQAMTVRLCIPHRPLAPNQSPDWTGAFGAFWDGGPVSSVTYHRSVWDWTTRRNAKWAWDPPILTGGCMNASYLKHDPHGERIVTTMLRRVLPCAARRFSSTVYAGHDALRWASEAPRRMIDGSLRPPDGWSFEKLPRAKRKYYQGLEAMRAESDPQPPPGYPG
jgi:hypothetical protein